MIRTNNGTRVNTANAPNTENKVLLIKLMYSTHQIQYLEVGTVWRVNTTMLTYLHCKFSFLWSRSKSRWQNSCSLIEWKDCKFFSSLLTNHNLLVFGRNAVAGLPLSRQILQSGEQPWFSLLILWPSLLPWNAMKKKVQIFWGISHIRK